MNNLHKKENIGMIGVYTYTKAKIETPVQKRLLTRIERARESGKPYIHLVRKLNQICKTEVIVQKNMIPLSIRSTIAANLTSATQQDIRINYVALGTDVTAVNESQTQLLSEVYRRSVASTSYSSNIASATAFYTATEVSGTFYEQALFSNATAVANSGIMASRVVLNGGLGITKSLTESLTIDYTVTIV